MTKSFGDRGFTVVGKGLNIRWHIGGLSGDGHAGDSGGGFGDGIAVGPEAFDVKVDSFANELFGCFVGWASYAETRKVWDVGAPAGGGLLEDDGVLFHGFIPACLKILLRVPSSISSEGCPAIVTLPGLIGCLNWRWLPR